MTWNDLSKFEIEEFYSDVLRRASAPLIDRTERLLADRETLDRQERDLSAGPGAASEPSTETPPSAESNAVRYLSLLCTELQLRRDLVLFFNLRHFEVRQAVERAGAARPPAPPETADPQASRRREVLDAAERQAMLTRSESAMAANRKAIQRLGIQIARLRSERASQTN